MTSGKRFNLANDFCYVLPHYIVITDHSDPNEILRRKEKNTFAIFLRLFSMLSFLCLLAAFYFIFTGRKEDSSALFIVATFGFLIAIIWKNKSNVRVIERSQIRNIQLKKVMFNPTFIILFTDKKKKLKQRMLVMKSTNPDEITRAVKIFMDEKLMRADLQKDFEKVISDVKLKESKQNHIDQKKSTANQYSGTHNKSEKSLTKSDKRDSNGYVKNY